MCPHCNRCKLTKGDGGSFCHDCGYDERFRCMVCKTILLPPKVAGSGEPYCPKGHAQLKAAS